MLASLRRTLHERHRLALVDEASVEDFLAGAPAHAVLFFAGDPAERPETRDVAVILPQLLGAFPERLRGALVTAEAEPALKERFHVRVLPSLVVLRGSEILGVLPKVYDWADYVTRLEAMLFPDAPALVVSSKPRAEIVFSSREAAP
ncbi:MAG: hydrogenase accessory protein [Methylocystis sp.]